MLQSVIQASKAFSGFSVNDIGATARFYGDTLGLAVSKPMEMIVQIQLGPDHRTIAYLKKDHQPATFTILNFPVDDIDAAVDGLKSRGVTFERYEGFNQDAKGIARSTSPEHGPSIAWFKDPSGNVLSVLQE